MLKYEFGDIILVAALLDPQGRNAKDRPAIVISSAVESAAVTWIEVMAITTLIPDPVPEDHFLIPWQNPTHPRTGLNKRCAAVGTWLMTISSERVIRMLGFVPGRQKLMIATWLAQ